MLCPACDHENIPGVDLCGECGMDLAGLDVKAWGVDPDDPLLAAPVGSIPLKDPLLLDGGESVERAIELMRDRRQGCVFVRGADAGLIGVFTERDVTVRVAARGRDPRTTRLEDVMTPNPVALDHEDPFSWALHRMGVEGHRHVPVLRDGRLVGFLSSRTVLQRLLDSFN